MSRGCARRGSLVATGTIAGHGGPILIDRELRGWSQGLADTT